jgi:hypothetical protein
MGNLTKKYYIDVIEHYRPDYRERILNGEYPAHLAKDGKYTQVWLTEEEITIYDIFNCPDEHFSDLKTGEYFGWPIIHNKQLNDSGIEPKLDYGRPLHLHLSFPDWSNWKSNI